MLAAAASAPRSTASASSQPTMVLQSGAACKTISQLGEQRETNMGVLGDSACLAVPQPSSGRNSVLACVLGSLGRTRRGVDDPDLAEAYACNLRKAIGRGSFMSFFMCWDGFTKRCFLGSRTGSPTFVSIVGRSMAGRSFLVALPVSFSSIFKP